MMQNNQKDLKKLKMTMQQNVQLQQVVQYLRNHNKLPFKNCLFTPKPAQKGQFTMQKILKQIVKQCKQINGFYILLCYQSQIDPQFDQTRSQKLRQSTVNYKNSSKLTDEKILPPNLKADPNLNNYQNKNNNDKKMQNSQIKGQKGRKELLQSSKKGKGQDKKQKQKDCQIF